MSEEEIVRAILDHIAVPQGIGTSNEARKEYFPIIKTMVENTINLYPDNFIDTLNEWYFDKHS